MVSKNFDILREMLRPLSEAEVAALVRARTGESKGEHLSLADAGLEDEVRELLARRTAKGSAGGADDGPKDIGSDVLPNDKETSKQPTGALCDKARFTRS